MAALHGGVIQRLQEEGLGSSPQDLMPMDPGKSRQGPAMASPSGGPAAFNTRVGFPENVDAPGLANGEAAQGDAVQTVADADEAAAAALGSFLDEGGIASSLMGSSPMQVSTQSPTIHTCIIPLSQSNHLL